MASGKWMQKARNRMENKGTVGLFTRKAHAHHMSPAKFEKYVLSHKDKFSGTTRKEAGFRKAAV